jgi:hypothetical protein
MDTTLNANTKGKILFKTNDGKYPFLIKTEDNLYILVKDDYTLSGDGFYKEEILRYFPKTEIVTGEGE